MALYIQRYTFNLRNFHFAPRRFQTSELKSKEQAAMMDVPNVIVDENIKMVDNNQCSTNEKSSIIPKTMIVNASSADYNTSAVNVKNINLQKITSFEEIPGPKLLRNVSQLFNVNYLPNRFKSLINVPTIQNMLSSGIQAEIGRGTKLIKLLLDEYGLIVGLRGPFNSDVVILNRPDYVEAVFKNEGSFADRSSLESIEKYRLWHRRYSQSFIMNGTEWEKLRCKIETSLQTLDIHFDKLDAVCNRFVERIDRIRNNQDEVPTDFFKEIYKWSLECFYTVAFNKNLGIVDAREIGNKPSTSLLQALIKATEAVRKCESGLPLWKLYETPSWKELTQYCNLVEDILVKHTYETQIQLQNKQIKEGSSGKLDLKKASFVEVLLLKDGLPPEEVISVLLDMLLIGIHASTHATSFLMYHLSRYPRVQRKLLDEIENVVDKLNPQKITDIEYLQACIKESLRLKPPVPVIARTLSKELIIDNYRIPRGTHVIMATYLSSLREENFEDAHKFYPERWINNENITTLASIPFGYGAKSCIAQKLAELQLSLLTMKLIKKYHIEYNYGDLNVSTKILAEPNRPLKFKFTERY